MSESCEEGARVSCRSAQSAQQRPTTGPDSWSARHLDFGAGCPKDAAQGVVNPFAGCRPAAASFPCAGEQRVLRREGIHVSRIRSHASPAPITDADSITPTRAGNHETMNETSFLFTKSCLSSLLPPLLSPPSPLPCLAAAS